jgi:C4-dicarboxylate transporter DctM subunit
VIIGIVGIVVLMVVMLVGVPVSLAMGLVGFIGLSYMLSVSAASQVLAAEFFSNFSSYSLSVIPMFVFMGTLAFKSGISRNLFDAAQVILGRVRGGLAMASVLASAGFAAVCGSTSATVAGVGAIAIPEMRSRGYDDSLACGAIAASGGLGILIPPSAVLVVYGIITQQSIGKLFIAGVLPGLLLTFLIISTVFFLCLWKPNISSSGSPTSIRQKLRALLKLTEVLAIFGFVMGGLFAGWFTPTQAGGAGVGAILVVSLVKKSIKWHKIVEAARESVPLVCMVMVLITGGMIFGRFIAATKIPFVISDWATAGSIPPWTVIFMIIIVHFIGGCFMDAFAMIVITIPILYPVVLSLGFDPIWFGIIIILIVEMGAITPPVGLNVFVIKGIAGDVPLETVFKGIVPFTASILVCILLIIAFPQIATYLVAFMSY